MPIVRMKPDTLNEENLRFEQIPLRQGVFLNSVPKSGSHLLRNIVRMFVPVEQQYHVQFIQWANLGQHLAALDPRRPQLSWGHLFFADDSAMELAGTRKILLVRDPYSWVLARARFFLSDEFSGNVDRLKQGDLSVEELLNLMIFGIYQKAPPMVDIYTHNAVAWLGTGAYLVRYEELVAQLKDLDGRGAEYFFANLFDACGIDMRDNWRERVRIGSDRKQSGTARENLSGLTIKFPDELPEIQKKLVNYAAPGLREMLGYR
ncbi:hypothetical protein [Sphingomonas sp. dw_22]|uniref:hypothetical protein n=1 Tax=Sphingomonas sp. dw_22 TaxID=2721175 RepID=UPI001BD4D890|nr:hypothetical protein [Sphingomonas sp. dw_22]